MMGTIAQPAMTVANSVSSLNTNIEENDSHEDNDSVQTRHTQTANSSLYLKNYRQEAT